MEGCCLLPTLEPRPNAASSTAHLLHTAKMLGVQVARVEVDGGALTADGRYVSESRTVWSARGMEVRSGGEEIRWVMRWAGGGDAEAPKDYIPIVWKGRCVGQGTSGLAEECLSARGRSEPAEDAVQCVQNQIAFCLLLHLDDAVGASIEHASHGKCGGEPMTRARTRDDPGLWEQQSGRA